MGIKKIQVWGKNKPIMRRFDNNGDYKEYRNANYSGHATCDNIVEATKIMQEWIKRGWDVKIEIN